MVVCGQRHTPTALPPGKNRYPLCRRLFGPQSRSGEVRKISPPPTGIRSPDRPARSQALSRLHHLLSINYKYNITHPSIYLCLDPANYGCLRAFTIKFLHVTYIGSTRVACQAHCDILRRPANCKIRGYDSG